LVIFVLINSITQFCWLQTLSNLRFNGRIARLRMCRILVHKSLRVAGVVVGGGLLLGVGVGRWGEGLKVFSAEGF
jgi:hypothetical protein